MVKRNTMKQKLNLKYIIIGDLPKSQRRYLEENLRLDGIEENGINIIGLQEETKRLGERPEFWRFQAAESIFISGDYKELNTAFEHGMATLGYLQKEGSAREHLQETPAVKEINGSDACSCTDMWAEGFEEIDFAFLNRVYKRHHGLPWTILATKRCVIKEFSMEYLDALFELYAGEGMTDYMEPLYPYEQEKEYEETYIKNMYEFNGFGMWIVCDKQTGKLIGRAGVECREELEGEMELGYAIGVPYQRQGYATEVCEAILKYVHTELQQPSICCLIEEGNTVSEHFAKKLGFSFEKKMNIDGKIMKKYCCVF